MVRAKDRLIALKQVEDYLRLTLLPELGIDGESVVITPPEHGVKSLILKVEAGENTYFIRCIKDTMEANCLSVRLVHLASLNIPAPRLLALHDTTARKKTGYALLVETGINGIHAEPPLNVSQAKMLGETMGKLTTDTRREWGQFERPYHKTYFQEMFRRVCNRLKTMKRQKVLNRWTHARLLKTWFDGWEKRCTWDAHYLTHDKIHKTNLIFNNDECSLIDFATLQYAPLERDLASIQDGLLHESTLCAKEAFSNSFWAYHNENERKKAEELAPVFSAWFYLSRWTGYERRTRKQLSRGLVIPKEVTAQAAYARDMLMQITKIELPEVHCGTE